MSNVGPANEDKMKNKAIPKKLTINYDFLLFGNTILKEVPLFHSDCTSTSK